MLAVMLAAALAMPADEQPGPGHSHGRQHGLSVRPQDQVVVTNGPMAGLHLRIVALQHKFFEAEVWAECLAMEPDANGHLAWLMVPVCALERVRPDV